MPLPTEPAFAPLHVEIKASPWPRLLAARTARLFFGLALFPLWLLGMSVLVSKEELVWGAPFAAWGIALALWALAFVFGRGLFAAGAVEGQPEQLLLSSLAVPMIAVGLCAPLTLHLVFHCAVQVASLVDVFRHTPAPFAELATLADEFELWIVGSIYASTLAHLVLAGMLLRAARRIRSGAPVRSFTTLLPSIVVGFFNGAFVGGPMLGRPGALFGGIETAVIIAVTGMAFVPLLLRGAKATTARERALLVEQAG